ncbi:MULTISPECIES: hypothetical protein [Lysinibacillus]|uniref:Cytochrome c oxidase subunit 4 n=1 Tax=Lysinibacillus fusiformis TaxID=28031 RepID=A0A1E4R6J6_9BACI|nr:MULTISPECIES: hypothetical protein [Lysinibacillus]ODV56092.1 hypothetical protein BG258_09340 [Lysinibacillus fusiformis]HBJ01956.1 hypothetical protein [Lysinibacillus sp.]
MISMLNVGSLVLGFIALLLPIAILSATSKQIQNYRLMISILSLSACAISISFQLFYNFYLVKIEDWSALMDITRSSVLAVLFLLVSTILLNILVLIFKRNEV